MPLLTWDDSYAIALALHEAHPDVKLDEVSLDQLFQWVIDLRNFSDDPNLVNDTILVDILCEWIEEF